MIRRLVADKEGHLVDVVAGTVLRIVYGVRVRRRGGNQLTSAEKHLTTLFDNMGEKQKKPVLSF